MQNISKRLAIAIIIFVLALTTGVLFWYGKIQKNKQLESQREDTKLDTPIDPIDTSDWQVYTNKEMGFEFNRVLNLRA